MLADKQKIETGKNHMEEMTMKKPQRPVREKDIQMGMRALSRAMNDWWELDDGMFSTLQPLEDADDAEGEADNPSPETLAEIVALFVARWRNCRLLTENPYNVVAFDERINDALSGALKCPMEFD